MEIQKEAAWYQYLDECQKDLVDVSLALIDKEQQLRELQDFSFIVFSMAKTYEGFLKKVFFDLELINKQTYEGRRFRIGRALNPDIRNHQRDEDWLYDDVAMSFGEPLARQLWDTWLICRNHVFHYFGDCKQSLSFEQAVDRVQMMVDSMQAVAETIEIKN